MFSQNVREEDPDLTELRKSSERKDPNAMFRLGAELYDGGRVPQDRTEALRLWREAADLGHPGARHNLTVAGRSGTRCAGPRRPLGEVLGEWT